MADRVLLLRELDVVRRADQVDAVHPIQGLYVETFWLPVLGPTTTWALRSLDRTLGVRRAVRIPSIDFGRSLGVGHELGKWSALSRALDRLVRFGIADWDGARFGIPDQLCSISGQQLSRLPVSLQALHQVEVAA